MSSESSETIKNNTHQALNKEEKAKCEEITLQIRRREILGKEISDSSYNQQLRAYQSRDKLFTIFSDSEQVDEHAAVMGCEYAPYFLTGYDVV